MRVLFIGGHGHHYLGHGVESGRAEIAGVAGDGFDEAAAQAWAARRNVTFIADADEALRKVQFDAVSVGAVYAHNGAVLEKALKAGCERIVSDKPIAGSWEQLERLEVLAAQRQGLRLVTEFDLRGRPAFRAAHEVVRRGWIGAPVLATAQKSYRFGATRPAFYRKRADYPGTLLWIASHGVDVVWYVTGLSPQKVTGHSGNVAKKDWGEFEDHVTVSFVLDGGASALVHADYLRPAAAATHGDDRLRVAGSEGVVEVRDGRCWLTTSTEPQRDVTELGEGADVVGDILAALDGEDSVFGTKQSLTMARWLLRSRDAADECRWLSCS